VNLGSMRMMQVSVSLPADLVATVTRRAGTSGFSQYVFYAVQDRLHQDLLAELLRELAAYGPIPADIRALAQVPLPDESAWAEMTARFAAGGSASGEVAHVPADRS
jgi:Arc/MetJ family transcription regulator